MNNTVYKTIEILKLVAANKDGLTLSQIVRELDLPKSTVFNIVRSLVQLDMLRVTEDKLPTYRLGVESLKLGLSYLSSTSLDTAARPVLSALCRDTNETVFMSVRSGDTDLVYIMKYPSEMEFQTICSVGTVRHMLSVAMGKAMLSTMRDEEIRGIITPDMFCKCSVPAITDIPSLLEYIHKTQSLGYAVEATIENPQFASSVAAPVLDLDDQLVGAVSIVIMSDPYNMNRVTALGKRVNAAALEISRNRGYMKDSLYSSSGRKTPLA